MNTISLLWLAVPVVLACAAAPNSPAHTEAAFTSAEARADTAAPGFGESPTYAPQLGVCVTLASDERIDGDPTLAAGAFQHVRYFQMMEKDYGDTGTPAGGGPAPCTNYDNPWACPEVSLRQNLVRVQRLRRMFPEGIVWVAPEKLGDNGWPCKNWSVEELGDDPEEAGYRWGSAAFASYGPLGDIVVAMTNEEWCPGEERAAAYNEWRRGVIRAHRENPAAQIAIGARHVRPRMWGGERLNDNVRDVAPDVWAYVDSVGGWADYHAHGIENMRFLPHAEAHTAEDYRDFFAWRNWLQRHYPNIRPAVGEIAYTTSEPGVVATDEEKRADWGTYASLVRGLADEAEIVFLYQIEDHPWPEGAFSGSGVYPTLMDSVRALASSPR